MPRKYELKRRRERQEETRQRIVEAVAALHEEVGPARTTVTAIAERAGVERLTVYRHFGDELSMFQACSQLHRSRHPLPEISPLVAIVGARERLRAALAALYSHYAEAEAMTANVQRDAQSIPALATVLESWHDYLRRLRSVLVEPWTVADSQQGALEAWIGHALEFSTWQSLVRRQGLSRDDAIDVLVAAANAVAGDNRAAGTPRTTLEAAPTELARAPG